MVIETKSAKETFELGVRIGKSCVPGEVYTLIGDLGVGKTVFTQGLAQGLEIEEPISSPTLYKCTKKGGCRFIILMYIESEISRRWTRLDMKIISMEMASVLLNGRI